MERGAGTRCFLKRFKNTLTHTPQMHCCHLPFFLFLSNISSLYYGLSFFRTAGLIHINTQYFVLNVVDLSMFIVQKPNKCSKVVLEHLQQIKVWRAVTSWNITTVSSGSGHHRFLFSVTEAFGTQVSYTAPLIPHLHNRHFSNSAMDTAGI